MWLHPDMVSIAESLSEPERQRMMHESLLETRAQGMEPSERSKELAQQWVSGEIGFVEMADGIYKEALREEADRKGRTNDL